MQRSSGRTWRTLSTLALSASLTACGGGSSETGAGASDQANGPDPILTGRLIDSAIEGVEYETATLSGVTNADGEFQYRAGESIHFRLGAIALTGDRAVLAQPVLTPVEVTGSETAAATAARNLMQLLQSLDDDGEPDNGIRILEAVRLEAADSSIDLAGGQFQTDLVNVVAQLTKGAGQVVDQDAALAHFYETVAELQANGDDLPELPGLVVPEIVTVNYLNPSADSPTGTVVAQLDLPPGTAAMTVRYDDGQPIAMTPSADRLLWSHQKTLPLAGETSVSIALTTASGLTLAGNSGQLTGVADNGDSDGDGAPDGTDAFPLDPFEWLDTDTDGVGNNADTDDDGDGVVDASDDLPLDPTETVDTDGDGIGNNSDEDDDGDGVNDAQDDAPLDGSVSDLTPPQVSAVTPLDGADSVALDSVVTATFDEDLFSPSVTAVAFSLNRDGNDVAATVDYNALTKTATLQPDVVLAPLADYTASVSTAVTDLAGNALSAPSNWQFSTTDFSWTGVNQLSSEASGNARVDMDAAGNAIAVWRQPHGNVWSAFAARFDVLSGTWSTPAVIDSSNSMKVEDPMVAVSANGDAIAIWIHLNDANTTRDLYANRYDALTGSWGSAEVIEGGLDRSISASAALDESGNALVVWTQVDSDTDQWDMQAARYDALTAAWSTVGLESAAGNVHSVDVAMDAQGRGLAIWTQHDGSARSLYWAYFDPESGLWSSAAVLESDGNSVTSQVSLDMDAEGNAVVAWAQGPLDAYDIYVRRFEAGTMSWLDPAAVESVSGWGGWPQVALAENGNIAVIWRQVASTWTVHGNQFDAELGSWDDAEQISAVGESVAEDPMLAIDPYGHAIAVWSQGSGTARTVAINRYNGSAGQWGAPTAIDRAGLNAQHPDVALDSLGRATGIWDEYDDSYSSRVFTNRFE